MWTIGRQAATRIEVAVRVPQHLVDVPTGVRVAPGPGDRAHLLLRVVRQDAGRRRVDLVGVGRAGVVAVQAAQRVIRAAEPVVREPPFECDLERIELPLGFRRGEVAPCSDTQAA